MANAAGDGSITKVRSGRYWVRSPVMPDGKRKPLGTYATREEAEAILETSLLLTHATALPSDAVTFEKFGRRVLDLREEEGIRGIAKERDRFGFHLAGSTFSAMPLVKIGAPHVAELVRTLMRKQASDKRGDRKIGRKTVQRVLAIVSSVFSEAVTAGIVAANPTVGVRVKKRADEGTKEPWAYLDPKEQRAVVMCPDIPFADKLIIRFAIGSGIRQGELCHQELRDLHVDGEEPFLFVRYGSRGKAPKSGKTRRVPLFGDALVAVRAWLEILPGYCATNPFGLIFPTKTGCRRQAGKPLGNGKKVGAKWEDRFATYLRAAGVEKHVRWHDLRHTCASSLVAGWWGRRWPIEEVKEMLGHSSIVVTQMYAHLGETSLKNAGRETAGPGYGSVGAARVELAHVDLKGRCSATELRPRTDAPL